MNVTRKARPKVITTLKVVHFQLLVSLKIVIIVVAQGLWSKENNIRFTAVNMVQTVSINQKGSEAGH